MGGRFRPNLFLKSSGKQVRTFYSFFLKSPDRTRVPAPYFGGLYWNIVTTSSPEPMLRKSYLGDTSPADSTCWGCNDRPRQVQPPAEIDQPLDLSRTSDVPGTSMRHALSIFEIVDFRSLIAHTFKAGEFSLALEIIQRASRLKKSAPAASQLLRIFETLVQCEQQYADLTCASLPAKTWALCRGARGRYTDGSKRSRKTKEMFAAYSQLIADCESVAQMYPAAAAGRRPFSTVTTSPSPAHARHPFPMPEGTCCRTGTWRSGARRHITHHA